jgi:hypothetical protein
MKKKIQFPKIKKHLQNFLTDESGKISKHNALWFWAVWALIWLVDWADAHHCYDTRFWGSISNVWTWGTWWIYYTASGTCGHASNIWNGGRPYTEYSNFSSWSPSVVRWTAPSLVSFPNYECNTGLNNSVRWVGSVNTYYRNCWPFDSSNSGHMSNIGRAQDASETTSHNNRHNNY